MTARQRIDTPPVTSGEQRPCPRGASCASASRDQDGIWQPLMINSAFCPADEAVIRNAIPGLPRSYFLTAARIGDPVRSGRAVRRPPGSRVLVDPRHDELLRTSSAVLMGWAARVRAVPGLSLSPPRHQPDRPEGVRDNCGILARHVTQLLALPQGPVYRTWTWPPGGWRPAAAFDRGTCRRCRRPVARPRLAGARWLAGDGAPAGTCEHDAAPEPERNVPVLPPDIDTEIGDTETVHAGEGWATCVTDLSGIDAGLDILDLQEKFRRLLQESPARPEPLTGIPCRECEELKLVEADPPHDPHAEKDKSRCTSCGARMTAAEYAEWTKMYHAWVKGAGLLVCKLCRDGDHGTCWWASCDCRRAEHAQAA